MSDNQREQNPDVNSYNPDSPAGENPGTEGSPGDTGDVERNKTEDVIPVPSDAEPKAPVEEPPGTEGTPVGDVDDSPKKIVEKKGA